MGDSIRPINPKCATIGCITKAIPSEFDNSLSYLEILYKLTEKLNQVINVVNNVLEAKIVEYIDKRFNEIMLDAMYDENTETLILYLNDGENN